MSRPGKIVQLIILLVALLGVAFLETGKATIPSGDSAIWLHCGLLMIIFGAYWIEEKFTRPDDVVINGLIAYISVSILESPPNPGWWLVLRVYSLALVVISFGISWAGTPALPRNDTSALKRFLYLLVIRLGNARVLFSIVFILSLISYFDLAKPGTKLLVGFWGIVVAARFLEIDTFAKQMFRLRKRRMDRPIGEISRVSEPGVVRFEVFENAACPKGAVVAFSAQGKIDDDCPLGLVTGFRSSLSAVEGEAIILSSTFREGTLDRRRYVWKVDTENPDFAQRIRDNAVLRKSADFVGVARQGTDISRAYVELIKDPKLEEGHLVSVGLQGRELFFQVINAQLHEEASIDRNERSFTVAAAEQLGTWSADRQGFETYSWVLPENAPLVRVSNDLQVEAREQPAVVGVGAVPNSNFPVNVSLRDLVLFHSAILGVTGSGKSFLAYHLIEKCAALGIKVVCLDATGDYRRYLTGAVHLPNPAAVKQFIGSQDNRIGIVEFSEERRHPIVATRDITKIALDWCRENRSPAEVVEPIPKVLLVLEEAHTLIPEWNSNPKRDLQDVVNETSQIALQARKYGPGFMVVTQRTANVTKSILNQCNTIVAFQAYDETGFDFMKNYMGDHYVRALPNLKRRQGVLVGKASVSDRPVIVQFTDQNRSVNQAPIPEWVAPAVANENLGAA